MPDTMERPSQVTIVVVLIWIGFALTVAGAIGTILLGTGIAASEQAAIVEELKRLDLPEGWATTVGPIIIVTGALLFVIAIIEAIFAIAISRGSNIARILLTILIAIRLVGGVFFLISSWGSQTFGLGVFMDMALGIIVLLLLYSSASNEYFTDRVARA